MNLYYAVGGGLGHFSRAIAFIHTQSELSPEKTIVMVADRPQFDLWDNCLLDQYWQSLTIVKIPVECFSSQEKLTSWLQSWLNVIRPQAIHLDTFPAGIMGEWSGIEFKASYFYVGRYLHWPAYAHPITIDFEKIFRVEPWHIEQSKVLSSQSKVCEDLRLTYPKAKQQLPFPSIIRQWQKLGKAVWAIIHSEPQEEVEALLSLARDLAYQEGEEPLFVVCSSRPVEYETEVYPRPIFPASALFPNGDKIITACGFNLMEQALGFRYKHHCIPFPRRFDNQFLRYQRWKTRK